MMAASLQPGSQSDEPGSTGGREEAIMLKMRWRIDHKCRLVPALAQSGEPQASKDHPDLKVPRLVNLYAGRGAY